MLKIAICDDEQPIREYLKRLVEKCTEAEVSLFADGAELLADPTAFDLILLDISLNRDPNAKEPNGMEAARKIRERSDALIIFVSALREYVFEGYDVGAFHYLLKPIDEQKFTEVMDRAIRQIRSKKNAEPLVIKVGGNYGRIPVEDIIYAENQARKIILHTKSKKEPYCFYEKMEVLEQKLGDRFFRSHRGFLVNMQEVARYDNSNIELKNGEKVFLAKQKYNDFVTAYMKKGILLLQYAVVQIFLHESGWVRNLFYENSVVSDSRQSIWPVLVSMLVTCVVSGILLRENRLKLFYGIATFYSVTELLKMAFHPVLWWVFRKLVDLNDYLFLKKQLYGEEMFYAAVSGIEIFWNILLTGTVLIFSYEILRRVKKYLALKEVHERSQLIFLLFPSLIGFLLCLMLRSMMFSMDGTDMYLLLDSRPEMNLLIPCVCWLCVLMILLAAKMLRKLIDENNHKIEVSVYQDRIREMEQHIGDIENLYAGIRGMQHDMKNYIADMEALMSGQPEQTPLRLYLNSLQTSVEQLDMKYHTGNPVTDVILQRYVKLTEKSGIDFQADFLFPANMNIDAFDLSIILNNALDNALEACKRQKEGKKFMELKAYRRENMFFILLKNSFDGSLNRDKEGGRLRTTKTDAGEHGPGLRNIEMCAEKYYGKAESTVRDKEFELAVMLQRGISG